jgi:hypothetical protein
MCDYSLHLVASRPAKVLVTTAFNNSLTCGFASVGEPQVAVCLLPGTEVAFEGEVECERFFWVSAPENHRGEACSNPADQHGVAKRASPAAVVRSVFEMSARSASPALPPLR